MPISQPLIKLTDISMRRNGRNVLENVNLTVNEGDFIAITGPNGGGKTTLLRIILKLLKPGSGTVEYVGDTDLRIGYLPQKNMIDSHFPITVEQVISSGLVMEKKLDDETRREKVEAMLRRMELEDRRTASIGQISGGQLQRALLGRALISEPKLLVLDEPLSYIDKKFEAKIYEIIAEVAKTATIILVSHEMSRISKMANRHVIVDHTVEVCTARHHYFTLNCNIPNDSL